MKAVELYKEIDMIADRLHTIRTALYKDVEEEYKEYNNIISNCANDLKEMAREVLDLYGEESKDIKIETPYERIKKELDYCLTDELKLLPNLIHSIIEQRNNSQKKKLVENICKNIENILDIQDIYDAVFEDTDGHDWDWEDILMALKNYSRKL